MATEDSALTVTASYTVGESSGLSTSKTTYSKSLAPANGTVADYMQSLGSALIDVQKQFNVFLTEEMKQTSGRETLDETQNGDKEEETDSEEL